MVSRYLYFYTDPNVAPGVRVAFLSVLHFWSVSHFFLKITQNQGANATMKIVCECGFTKTCNMSGGVDESDRFNHMVTENIMAHNMNVHTTQKWLQGMNFRSKNLQGNICGINLEHRKMSDLRNQLYIDVIKRKNAIEDEMLQAVLNQSDCPFFSFDGFYSDR